MRHIEARHIVSNANVSQLKQYCIVRKIRADRTISCKLTLRLSTWSFPNDLLANPETIGDIQFPKARLSIPQFPYISYRYLFRGTTGVNYSFPRTALRE